MSVIRASEAMSVEFAEPFDDRFLEPIQERRLVVRIPGRFSLASRRDTNGNRRQFACRAINISQSTVWLAAPVSGPIGERAICYFEEFGKIQGQIVRLHELGFVIRVAASNEDRAKLLRKLVWLEQNTNFDIPDSRTHKRIIPEDPISTLIFADGRILGCFVIDMSSSGAAVSSDIIPDLGTVLAVGTAIGTVVRHFPEGFAVRFKQLQDPNILEQVVIHRS
jgi:hypothetical protein